MARNHAGRAKRQHRSDRSAGCATGCFGTGSGRRRSRRPGHRRAPRPTDRGSGRSPRATACGDRGFCPRRCPHRTDRRRAARSPDRCTSGTAAHTARPGALGPRHYGARRCAWRPAQRNHALHLRRSGPCAGLAACRDRRAAAVRSDPRDPACTALGRALPLADRKPCRVPWPGRLRLPRLRRRRGRGHGGDLSDQPRAHLDRHSGAQGPGRRDRHQRRHPGLCHRALAGRAHVPDARQHSRRCCTSGPTKGHKAAACPPDWVWSRA